MMTPYNNPDKFHLHTPFAPALMSEVRVPKMMPQILSSWDMTATFIVSIYMTTGAAIVPAGGPATLLYISLAGLTFFLPCLITAAQLGSMFPYEGALYNWTHRAIGSYWSFFSSFCTWLPGILISSNIANLFINYSQTIFHFSLTTPLQQGIAISAVLLVTSLISTRSFRKVQSLINFLTLLLLVSAVLVGLAAILWLIEGHHSAAHLHDWSSWSLKPENFSLFGIYVLAFIGVERPLNLAGEMIGRRIIRRHLIWGGLILFTLYFTNTLAVLIVQGPQATANPLTMIAIVTNVLGEPFGTIVTLCLMGSFFAAMLAYNAIFTRLLFVVGLDHHLPIKVGKLNKQQVPVNAILFQALLAIVFTLLIFVVAPLVATLDPSYNLAAEIFSITQATASLVWIIAATFLFIDLIGCYLSDRQGFYQRRIMPIPLQFLCILLGLASSTLAITTILLFSWTPLIPDTVWIYLVGSLTMVILIVSTFSSMIARGESAWHEMRSLLLDTEKRKAQSKKVKP
jgi:amino acid transporter